MEKITLFSPDRVYYQLCVDSKKQLFEALADSFVLTNEALNAQTLFTTMIERERLGCTGIGRGIAIPHVRIEAISRPTAIFMQLATAIDYDSIDKQPVDLVLALLVPSDANSEHLALLSRIAKMFSNTNLCEQLRRCRDSQILSQLLNQQLQPADAVLLNQTLSQSTPTPLTKQSNSLTHEYH